MPLDRTWYNALVNDSGSGLDGSVWDKADIKNLLDSVDAELARIDAGHNAHCLVRASAAYPLASGVWAPLSFDVVIADPLGMRISATDHRVPVAGIYGVTGTVVFNVSGAGSRYAAMAVNGAPYPNYPPAIPSAGASAVTYVRLTEILKVPTAGQISFLVHQDSGSPLLILTDTRLHVWRIA